MVDGVDATLLDIFFENLPVVRKRKIKSFATSRAQIPYAQRAQSISLGDYIILTRGSSVATTHISEGLKFEKIASPKNGQHMHLH